MSPPWAPASSRLGVLVCMALFGCAHEPDPAALQSAYLVALGDDDSARAWGLMSPEAQATTDRESFERRWRETREQRHALADRPRSSADDPDPSLSTWLEGVTIHERGHRLTWTEVDGAFVATGGLGATDDRRTPLTTLTAFARALRAMDADGFRDLVGPELSRTSSALVSTRASSIEAVLEDPSRITLDDAEQARVLIEPGLLIRLQRFDDGWRIVSLGE